MSQEINSPGGKKTELGFLPQRKLLDINSSQVAVTQSWLPTALEGPPLLGLPGPALTYHPDHGPWHDHGSGHLTRKSGWRQGRMSMR